MQACKLLRPRAVLEIAAITLNGRFDNSFIFRSPMTLTQCEYSYASEHQHRR